MQQSIAPILDLVRQPNAPAVLCLGNTTKAALHGRGSGVIEDRADIIFEVRDATNYTPSGDRIWYEELPESGAAAYASRARRKADSRYLRLAFIPSKYRVGTQPLPLLIEVRFDRDPWELEDVTGRIVGLADSARAAAARERQHTRTMAVAGLCLEVQVRAASDRPMLTTEAVEALMAKGLVRSAARRLIQELVGTHLKEIRAVHDRGKPRYLVPLATPTSATPGENETHDEPRQLRANEVDILAGSEESGRPESISPNGRSAGLGRAPAFPPDSLTDEIASRKCLRCNRTLLEFREHDSDFECDLCKFTQANDAHGPTTEMPADLLTRTAEERSTKERSQS